MIFLSHANPEDNEVTLWLALRLAAEGYPVWCDLTKLLGGEVFWNDIEEAIRDRTVRFLFVLSRSSNSKPSPRDELGLALKVERNQKLKNFVIPIWVDDLPSSDFNVQLTNHNAIPFRASWASGLAQLLKRLEEDEVPRSSSFGPPAVSSWWREYAKASAGVTSEPQTLVTNFYRLEPTTVYFHELERIEGIGPLTTPEAFPFPAARHNQYLVSFAAAEDLLAALGADVRIRETHTRTVNGDNVGQPRLWTIGDERKVVSNLLRQAWEAHLKERNLPTHSFSNRAVAFYFQTNTIPSNRGFFTEPTGERNWRAVVGTKTIKRSKDAEPTYRYWHFGLHAKPSSWPNVGYVMKPHVLFSDDGLTVWESNERLHRARRSQCKNWWNALWRDRIAASVAFLCGEDGYLSLRVGRDVFIKVNGTPLRVIAPVLFDESSLASVPEEVEDPTDLEDEIVDEALDDEFASAND